jgi:hypothetical protein
MVNSGIDFSSPFFLFFVACCAHGALACQEIAGAVLTGLWKRCARMLRRIVNDNLSGNLSDAAHAWLSTKTVGLPGGQTVGRAILHHALQLACLLCVSQWCCSCTAMAYATVRGVVLSCHIRVNEASHMTIVLWCQRWCCFCQFRKC